MIPNLSNGESAVGLATYLAGPGYANEHENPHLVAGTPRIMSWYSNAGLSNQDAIDIGREIDQPHRVFDVDVKNGHVLHASLSLHKLDGIKTDEEWEAIATDFMRELGMIDVDGKADIPWAAFRHGVSGQNGNDHIHIAASLVREDGTRVHTYRNYDRSQTVARGLEQRYGLLRIVPGHGAPGFTAREKEASKRRGREEPERATLGRIVRGSAHASVDEAEFVRRLRGNGLLVKPHFESEKMDAVNGYAVALKPPPGFRPLYHGGFKVARDLGIGVLRDGWETPSAAKNLEALDEWRAAKFGKPMVVTDGRETHEVGLDGLARAAEELGALRTRLRDVPFDDHEQWRRAASYLSGAYASWSTAVEATPGELARVADELAKSSQVSRSAYAPAKSSGPMGAYTATALAVAASHGNDTAAALAVFVHMSKLTASVLEAQRAYRDKAREVSLLRMASTDLSVVSKRMHDAAGVKRTKISGSGVAPVRTGQVMGPDLEASRTRAAKHSTGRGR